MTGTRTRSLKLKSYLITNANIPAPPYWKLLRFKALLLLPFLADKFIDRHLGSVNTPKFYINLNFPGLTCTIYLSALWSPFIFAKPFCWATKGTVFLLPDLPFLQQPAISSAAWHGFTQPHRAGIKQGRGLTKEERRKEGGITGERIISKVLEGKNGRRGSEGGRQDNGKILKCGKGEDERAKIQCPLSRAEVSSV